jgi:hypothetical protein
VAWCATVIALHPTLVLHVNQGNHGSKLPTNTPPSNTVYYYFKSFQHIFFPSIFHHSHNLSTPSPNLSIKSKPLLSQSYSPTIFTTTMSQSSHQTSSPNTSPNKPSPSKTTTTTVENPIVSLPQPSDIITNAVPLTMVHPSFASALNLPKNTISNPSPSPKPKSKRKSKTNTTKKPKSQKPKSQKPKSRYSSNFNM